MTTIDPESTAGAPAPQPDAPALSDDERRLHELGYAQELRRGMSGFSNFAVSFTIICILSGCLTLYGFGMNTGGPAVMVWGWPVVGLFTLMVGLGMAEVCSSFPTARGVRLVAVLNNVSVWWQVVGVAIVVGALALLPSHHQSVSFVFTHFVNNTGWGSALYVIVLGLLVAQYTFTGFDASAHMTEETINAARCPARRSGTASTAVPAPPPTRSGSPRRAPSCSGCPT